MPTSVIVQNNCLFCKSSEGLLGFFFPNLRKKKSILVNNVIRCIKCVLYSNSTKVLKIAFFNQVQHNVDFISLTLFLWNSGLPYIFLFIISLICTHSHPILTQSLVLSFLLSFWKRFITSFYNTTRFHCLVYYFFLRLMWEILEDYQRVMLIKD